MSIIKELNSAHLATNAVKWNFSNTDATEETAA